MSSTGEGTAGAQPVSVSWSCRDSTRPGLDPRTYFLRALEAAARSECRPAGSS